MVVIFLLVLQVALVFGKDNRLLHNNELKYSELYSGSEFNIGGRHQKPDVSSCKTRTLLSPGTSCVFTSPGYPRPYPRGSSKYFLKSLNRNCNIQIKCSDFQLPWSDDCSNSTHLFMKWGLGPNEWKWLCDSKIPSAEISSSFWVYAKFHSNQWRNRSYRGFSCTASTICPTTTTTIMNTPSVKTTGSPITSFLTTTATTTATPNNIVSTTAVSTTIIATTVAPTTAALTTAVPTMTAPTTMAPTTVATTTPALTTLTQITATATSTIQWPICKRKENCIMANGVCKNRNECSGDRIKNGCKGGNGSCVCCLDSPKPQCEPKKKCRDAKGLCQIATECSGKQIKNGCKGDEDCICCIVES